MTTQDIKKNLLNYFKHIETNVDILNKEYIQKFIISTRFTKQYSYCTNELKTIFYTCSNSIEKMEKDIKFNKRFIKTLQKSVVDYDGLIAKYYESNMLLFAKGVCNISEKNNIINQYAKIEVNLKKYFQLTDLNSNDDALIQVRKA